jgi:hypothetical protein
MVRNSLVAWGKHVIVSGVIVLAFGCAKAKITSMATPDPPRRSYGNIMVLFPVSDLRDREQTERRFVDSYEGVGPQFVASSALFHVGHRYSSEEVSMILSENRVDAVLLFYAPDDVFFEGRPRGPDELSSYLTAMPLPDAITRTLADPSIAANSADRLGDEAACRECRSSPQVRGSMGGLTPDPWTRSAVVLREVGSGRAAWTAVARASDMFWSDPSRYFQSIAQETLAQLRADGILP